MAEAREAILRAVQASRKTAATDTPAQTPAERLEAHPAGPRPALGSGTPLDVFIARADASGASLSRVSDDAGAVSAVTAYLQEQGLRGQLVTDSNPLLRGLPWPADLAIREPPLKPDDLATLTLAYAAVAETGSLALLSSLETPTALNFLPDHYLCLLPANRVVAHLEDLWALLRSESRAMPRTLNLITGPSRTADVEQTIQMGAHGPRSVHIVLLESVAD